MPGTVLSLGCHKALIRVTYNRIPSPALPYACSTERCSQCLSNRFINSGARAGPGLGWHSGLGKVPS